MKSIIVLSDGTELSSGVGTVNAIQSVTVTHETNSDQNLAVGSTCSSMLEATLITPGGGLSLSAGEEITLYKEQEDGDRKKIGVYILEKPTKINADAMRITAFDRITKLDKDMTLWFAGLEEWPYTLFDMATMVCTECGLTLENEDLPNGDFPVQQFSADGITGRDMIRWIGQAAGRFCVATPDGNACFDWYRENEKGIGTDLWYYQGGLSFEDYTVQAIEKVQIRKTADDIGTFYPDAEGNTYVIEGNPMLSALDAETLLPVAQTLYEQLKDVVYTPCNVSIPATLDINAGDIVSVTDTNGEQFKAYIMSKKSTGDRDSLESRGTATRESTLVVSNKTFAQYMGRFLTLKRDVEGIQMQVGETSGDIEAINESISGIVIDAGKISTMVSNTQTALNDANESIGKLTKEVSTKVTAEGVEVQIKSAMENGTTKVDTGTGLAFTSEGMTIDKEDGETKTRIAEDGMTVYEKSGSSEEAVLAANAGGVDARNLHATTYLIVGKNSRFEDFGTGRTGCFWIGGN